MANLSNHFCRVGVELRWFCIPAFILAAILWLAGWDAYGSCNERCIISMRCIPVSSIKNPNGIIVILGQVLEELYKSAFIINL
jgi:hypothetical protein